MRIIIVAALSDNRVIGKDNTLPWNLPADKEHLYRLVRNKTVLMGRKTYESIGHPLENCRNIILSRNTNLKILGCEVYASSAAALSCVEDVEELLILGGEKIYEEFIPLASKMYLTIIHHDFVGDTFFPEWDRDKWQVEANVTFAADAINPYAYSFLTLIRN